MDTDQQRFRPAAMRPRRALVRVHRWVSFGLLVWLVVIAATGVTLVFQQQLNAWFRPELYRSTPGEVGPQAVIDAVLARSPRGAVVQALIPPDNGRGVWQIRVGTMDPNAPPAPPGQDPEILRHDLAFVDPGTGHVNGVRDRRAGFTWWMYRGHMYLWQDEGFLGVDGDDLVAWLALAWIVTLVSGLYLWYWPRVRRWRSVLRVRRRRGPFTFSLDVHKATGVLVAVPLLIISFTGAGFAFPAMNNLYERVTPARAGYSLYEPPEAATVSGDPAGRPALDGDELVAELERRYSGSEVKRIMPPAEPGRSWSAWLDRGFSTLTREGAWGNSLVHLDGYSAETLWTGSSADANVADQLWDEWSYSLHYGDFLGTPSRWVWLAVAASPLVLGGTGTAMSVVRRLKRARHHIAMVPRRLCSGSCADSCSRWRRYGEAIERPRR